MAFVTYILLSTLLAGLRGAFHPELLGLTATTAFAVVIFEILGLKLGCYLLSISNESQLLDLVAYSGYKFVGIIVTLVVSEILNRGKGSGGWMGWTIFAYTFLANAFFLVCPLKLVLLYSLTNANPKAPLSKICSAPRTIHRLHPRRHPHRRPLPAQPPHAVPLPILVYRPIHLHVDTQQAGINYDAKKGLRGFGFGNNFRCLSLSGEKGDFYASMHAIDSSHVLYH